MNFTDLVTKKEINLSHGRLRGADLGGLTEAVRKSTVLKILRLDGISSHLSMVNSQMGCTQYHYSIFMP